MRDGQARLVHDLVAVDQEIEVDRARAPELGSHSAEPALDREDAVENLMGTQACGDSYRSVEEARLLDRADRLRVAERRDRDDVDPRLGPEQLDRSLQVGLTISQVRADTHESVRHVCCYVRSLE